MVGGMEAGGEGGAETKVAGDGGHDGQDDGGIEVRDLAAAADIGVEAALVEIIEAKQVGEEAGVEPGGFQQTGDGLIALGAEDVGRASDSG